MKIDTTVLLGITLAAVAGLLLANVSGLIGQNNSASLVKTGVFATGHVETIVTDSQGNVKEYRQSDNIITNTGENCAARLLFKTNEVGSSGTGACSGALTAPWNVIAIGNGSAIANGTDIRLGTEHNAVGLTRLLGTTVITNTTASTPASSAVVTIENTFTNNSPNSQTVVESGLFNGTTVNGITESMFARQVFNTITLNNGDSLTVEWTINIGGTQNTLTQNQ